MISCRQDIGVFSFFGRTNQSSIEIESRSNRHVPHGMPPRQDRKRHVGRLAIQAKSRLRNHTADEAAGEARKVAAEEKIAARNAHKLERAGTTHAFRANAIQQELIERRTKGMMLGTPDHQHALLLAAEDMKGSYFASNVSEYRLAFTRYNLQHLVVPKEFSSLWAHCFKCADRLVNGYFICKGCLHVAWCSEACHEADKELHKQVCITFRCFPEPSALLLALLGVAWVSYDRVHDYDTEIW